MLKLYFTPTTCATASHIALAESGAEYETELVKLYRPEAHEAYKAGVNPKGAVPALSVDGEILTENLAIMTYVARRFSQARLLPEAPLALARCLSVMAWMASTVHLSRRQARAPQKFTTVESAQEALKADGRAAFWNNLKAIDALLQPGPWIMGDQFTVVDGYALVFYGWGMADEQPMGELAAYGAFKDRMLARPAVRRVLEAERSPLLPQPAAQ